MNFPFQFFHFVLYYFTVITRVLPLDHQPSRATSRNYSLLRTPLPETFTMAAKKKYSRSTWKKKQLQQNMNTPKLGSTGCSLCASGAIPEDLNAHVSEYQTCADVHLQLALLRYDNAMCAVGQEQYRELCCTTKSSKTAQKTSLAFIAGVALVVYILKRILSSQKHRVREHDDSSDKGDNLPMTHQRSSSSSSSSRNKRSKSSSIELPIATYHTMEDVTMIMRSTSQSRSRSRSRPQSRSGSRGRPQSRPRERSQSRSRALAESRVTSSIKSESISRGKMQQRTRSHSRSKSRDRKAQQPHSDQYIPPPVHVINYNSNAYQRHEEVEVSSDIGPILPTQLV